MSVGRASRGWTRSDGRRRVRSEGTLTAWVARGRSGETTSSGAARVRRDATPVLPASAAACPGASETSGDGMMIAGRSEKPAARGDPGHLVSSGGRAVRPGRSAGSREIRASGRAGTPTAGHGSSGATIPSGRGRQADEGGSVGHHDERGSHQFTVAIDGPAAAGKSTVGERVAERLHAVYFDTGILYRALTLEAVQQGIDPADERSLARLAAELDVRIQRPSIDDGRQSDVILAGKDVTWDLRSEAVDRVVSEISALPAVRLALLETQRRIGRSGRVVMVGRDIGTVVMPDADVKIFLVASVEERARRRYEQFRDTAKGQDLDRILTALRHRDEVDSQRDVAPLRPADDALVIDTDPLSIDQVVDRVVAAANERLRVGQRR